MSPSFLVRVLHDDGAEPAQAEVSIDGPSAIVGRDPQCDVSLPDHSSVSRRHVRIEWSGQGPFRVVDLGSANGTWIGERRVSEAVVEAGERIRIGDATFECRPAAVTAADDPQRTIVVAQRGAMLGAAARRQLESAGEDVEVGDRQSLLLDDPAALYYVVDGTLDVFTVTLEEGRVLEGRRHLATLRPGDLIPGGSSGNVHNLLFLGLAATATRLRRLPHRTVESLAQQPHVAAELAAQLDRWIATASLSMPSSTSEKPIEAGKTVEPGAATSMIADGTLWDGLRTLQDALCASVASATRRGVAAEAQRLDAKARQADGAEASAVDALGAVLAGQGQDPHTVGGSGRVAPVVEACRRAAADLGIEVRAPHVSTADQTFATHVAAVAFASGFRTRQVALRGEWWSGDAGALVGQTGSGAPVTLLRRGRSYLCVDAAGASSIVGAGVAATLAPFAYALYRPLPAGLLRVRDLLRFGLRGVLSDVRTMVILGLLGGILGAIVPLLTGQMIDRAIPQAERGVLFQLGLGMLAVKLATTALAAVQGVAIVRIETRMDEALQAGVWARLLTLPTQFFRQFGAGDLAQRAAGIDAIRQIVSSFGIRSILGIFNAVAFLAVMLWISPSLSAVAITVTGVLVAGSVVGNYLLLGPQRREIEQRGRIASLVQQLIAGVAKVRVSNAESHAFRIWAERFAEQKRMSFALGRLQNALATLSAGFQLLAPLAIFAAIYRFRSQSPTGLPLSAGDFVAFYSAFGVFVGTTAELCNSSLRLLAVVAHYERLEPLLAAAPEGGGDKALPDRLQGELSTSRLHFRYRGDGPWVLQDVSVTIRRGEFVALVGASGCGKSTLLRLLLGFEVPTSGAVYYDGIDLSQLDVRALRRQLGVVLQDSRLLPTDIFRNIVGDTAGSVDDAWRAATLAGLADDIRQMPMGMNTLVSEGGGTFSGGQRQRVMIARALAAEPRIVMFDEATSALDNQSQALVTGSLAGLRATRVIIAHRLSTVVNVDRIIYLDNGRVAEEGSYAELMSRNGLFAQLARRQLK